MENKCVKCQGEGGGKGKSGLCARCSITSPKSEAWKEKKRQRQLGAENSNWKGNKVGCEQLHRWVISRLKKPEVCECCKAAPPYDLANKGVYNRTLSNWEWLCRRCHVAKDGRIKRLAMLNSSYLIYKGERKTAKEWANKYHLNRHTLLQRIRQGLSVAEAIEKPTRRWRR